MWIDGDIFFFMLDFCIYNFNCLCNCVLCKVDINGRLKFQDFIIVYKNIFS